MHLYLEWDGGRTTVVATLGRAMTKIARIANEHPYRAYALTSPHTKTRFFFTRETLFRDFPHSMHMVETMCERLSTIAWDSGRKLFQFPDLPPNYALHCDMDGVVADYTAGVMKRLQKPFNDVQQTEIQELYAESPDFFDTLPMILGAPVLMRWVCEQPDSRFLSVTISDDVRNAKESWLRRNAPATFTYTPVSLGQRKTEFLVPEKVNLLIDDYEPNVQAWRKAGHPAIMFDSVPQLTRDLANLFQ